VTSSLVNSNSKKIPASPEVSLTYVKFSSEEEQADELIHEREQQMI
jgi:hypothetical protein